MKWIEDTLTWPGKIATATFGMGCFWGPEARFGSLPGVVRTRVGYTGGTTDHPAYRNLGDHTETVEIDFAPALLPYEEVLRHFWRNHYPNRDEYKGRQYISLLRYHDEEQREAIERVKREMEEELGESIETDIGPLDIFTLAEERHQKYHLKRYPNAVEQLRPLYPDEQELVHSTFAARLNGFVKGFRTKDSVRDELAAWQMDEQEKRKLLNQFEQMKW